MRDAFVPFDVYARRADPPEQSVVEGPAEAEHERDAYDARDVRLFFAALADALDAVRSDLLRDLSVEVLGRELALEEVDVARIAQRLLEQFERDEPLTMYAHADDVKALGDCGVPVHAAEGLRRGDVRLELRYGSIDASLGARLASVLRARAS